MNLSDTIRYLIEDKGIDFLYNPQFCNYIHDLCSEKLNGFRFIWEKCLLPNCIFDILNSDGSNEFIFRLTLRIEKQYAFPSNYIRTIIESLIVGIKKAFYGTKVSEIHSSLLDTFYKNRCLWQHQLEIFKAGVLKVRSLAGKWGYITINGVELICPQFLYCDFFHNGIAYVENQVFKGFINILGNVEIDLTSTLRDKFVTRLWHLRNGLIVLDLDSYKVLLTQTGKFCDVHFDHVDVFNGYPYDLVKFEIDKKYGYINSNLEIIVKPIYDHIFDFRKGGKYCIGKKSDGTHDIINLNGQVIKNLDYVYKTTSSNCILLRCGSDASYIYSECLKRIRVRGGLWVNPDSYPLMLQGFGGTAYFYNQAGSCLSTDGYESATPFSDGVAWVKVGLEWRKINEFGKVLFITKEFDILTEILNDRMLARHKTTGLICLCDNCCNIITMIPDSVDKHFIRSHVKASYMSDFMDKQWRFNDCGLRMQFKFNNLSFGEYSATFSGDKVNIYSNKTYLSTIVNVGHSILRLISINYMEKYGYIIIYESFKNNKYVFTTSGISIKIGVDEEINVFDKWIRLKKDDKYYIMDLNFNVISDAYDYLFEYGGGGYIYPIIGRKHNHYSLIGFDGIEISPCKYLAIKA